jgi:hypothetical protein
VVLVTVLSDKLPKSKNLGTTTGLREGNCMSVIGPGGLNMA